MTSQASPHHSHTDVDVLLTARDRQDAEAVFDELSNAFDATSAPRPAGEPAPEADPSGHPVVWSLCVNTRTHHDAHGTAPLHGPVTADLSGGPHYVRDVYRALSDAFTVEEQGHVSGDQEVELRLRLMPSDRTTA
jgi:hypothetical protein